MATTMNNNYNHCVSRGISCGTHPPTHSTTTQGLDRPKTHNNVQRGQNNCHAVPLSCNSTHVQCAKPQRAFSMRGGSTPCALPGVSPTAVQSGAARGEASCLPPLDRAARRTPRPSAASGRASPRGLPRAPRPCPGQPRAWSRGPAT
eukprot:2743450-Lingulodinium_polyedra.AAC.1